MPERKIELGAAGHAVRANVLRLRTTQRLTTMALSKRLAELGRPIQATGITKIEKGTRRVDADDLSVLALAFGVRPEQLLETVECEVCHGKPPAGFVCGTCWSEAADV